MAYVNRKFPQDEKRSAAKFELLKYIKELSGYSLTRNTLAREKKINLLVWEANYYVK